MSDMDPDEWYDEEGDDGDQFGGIGGGGEFVEDLDYIPSEGDGEDEFDFDDDDEDDDVNEGEMRDFEAIITRMRGGVEGEDGEDEEDEGDEAGEAAEVADEVEEDEDEDDVVVDEEESARNRSTMTTLAGLMRQAAQEQPDGTLYIPHSFFRQLFASGLLPRDILQRIERGRGADDEDEEDEDDDDDDEDDEEDEDDDGMGYFGRPRMGGGTGRNGRTKGWDWFDIEREGKEAGRKLARGGEFGRVGFPGPEEVRTGMGGKVPRGHGSSHGEEDEVDEEMMLDHELAASPTSTIATHLSMSPTSTTSQNDASIDQRTRPTRRRSSGASCKNDLGVGAGGRPSNVRRLSGSSLASRVSGMEDGGRVRGIKGEVSARGAWGKGMKGFGKEVGRGTWGASGREEWGKKCVPNTNGTIVATYESSPYIGQHSHDYSFFYTATKEFQLHMYSTQDAPRSRLAERAAEASATSIPGSRPVRSTRSAFARRFGLSEDGEDHSMRKIKTVQGVEGQWTVTDANLSRDNQWMIYSSINPRVHLLRTAEHEHEHTMLDFSENRARGYYSREFGIWSVRFSADQKEIVAGAGSGQIMIYDIEAKRRILNIAAHNQDVNGVCFADENSTNVIVSASDDGYLKVWDRRSIASSVPSGVLVGATEGLTYVDTKGDGRYILANGKDQAMRLWDLRKMRTWGEIQDTPDAKLEYGIRQWDYRNVYYRKPRYEAHPLDCSVMTYRGHRVLQTLIRCHFSPSESTGGQYVYSGGSNGVIWIYHLDGRVVQVLDRTKAQPLINPNTGEYNDPSAPSPVVSEYDPDPKGSGQCCVRDVSWNGNEPSMISTAWAGHSSGGNIAVHYWKGLGKGGLNRLEDWVEVAAANGGEGVGDDGRA